ncbi:MAG: MATE family efflux transporter, partial [Clostridiales bacterium]|nr:MATE family efflux transporter [Clostridiales bacterium]
LDLIFVGPFGWGAGGAAAATAISQGVSFLLSIWYLRRSNFIFDFKRKSFKINKKVALQITKIGIPSSVQMTLISVSFLFLATIVNSYGVEASAANGIGIKVDTFAVLPALAFSSAISSMAGQNIGAREFGRAKQTLIYGIVFAFITSLILFAVVQVFSEQFVVLFNDNKVDLTDLEKIRVAEETVRIGKDYLQIAAFSYPILAFMMAFNGFATGSGNSFFTMINTFVATVLLRVPLAYILSGYMGINGVFLSLVIAPIGGALAGLIFFLSGRWKKGRVTGSVVLDA